ATLCGGLALIQTAPAPASPPATTGAASKSAPPDPTVTPKTRALLHTTAIQLEKTTGGAVAPPSTAVPKDKTGPASPPTTTPHGTKPGVDVSGSLPDLPQATMKLMGRCVQMALQGDRFASQGQWDAATESYAGALEGWPSYRPALYGIAACAGAAGAVRDEILYYRHAIYSLAPGYGDGQGFREGDPTRLMTFALLLQQTGQTDEAIMVYNHAVAYTDYDHGKPRLPVLLAEFGPEGAAYTPQRLQAMAQLALGIESSDRAERMARMTEALRLAPDSAASNYYLAVEYHEANDNPTARAYMARARQLGDAADRAAVDRMLSFIPPFKTVRIPPPHPSPNTGSAAGRGAAR
ncbi:MAG TPA: hypothetical protein VNL71_07645, partial [Chloroflexota bacterium]|nr:hypothetical protein [Chloroflexota bacterium]